MSAVEGLRPFNDAVNHRIRCMDKLQFYEGPVRSGKTQSSLLSLILYISTRPVTVGMMSGNTVGSLIRNCIRSKMGFLDLCPKAQLVKKNNVDQILVPTNHGLVTIYLFGADKSNSEDSLRGLTAEFWYADEITKHHENFIAEAMARIAASDYPFMVWTSNPDNPNNHIYKTYTDRFLRMSPKEKETFGGYHEFHFKLEDNPIMTPVKIERLKLNYTGVDYRRKILGERCIAEGLIYPKVDDSYFRDFDISKVDVKYCAIDFGADHPTTMGFGGMFDGNKKDWRFVKEYYDKGSDKTTYDHYVAFLDICKQLKVDPNRVTIAIDPAAKSLRVEFQNHGLNVIKAKNDVLEGLSYMRNLLYSNRVMFHSSMIHTRDEFGGYAWDPTASQRGEDKPIKINDDCMDMVRYFGMTFIKQYIN